ncbi:putative aminodeoxychorismate lyase [Candidatus Ornithobacterium hominis]|uniref:endolytic transglycosylase MltG n=1 Tax=Candidatus Ornithobacterium hominis TaxID=2497989 RepID=UPI000E5B4798|nr:endolytic transglycosylase MltG [Candidatus Ornithobacterium hominis]SZD72637.1 putative aminodeoxychorismate lyase [Candidatus Ornithobacterium hominis]
MKKILLFIIILIFFQSCGYLQGNKENVAKESVLYIPQNASYKQVLDSLRHKLSDVESFDSYAKTKSYQKNIKAGRYILTPGKTNEELVNKLMLGEEDEINLLITNEPTIFHLARDVAKKITADSAEIVNAILNHPQLKEKGLDLETSKIYFIPNTYRFFWITSGEDFVNRMIKEHDVFWNKKRLEKLKNSGMTELEVYTLASIVQMESSKIDEQPKVARAYLNRLEQGHYLQADPTSVYAWKLQNGFTQQVQRVYHKHLKTISAYNTYKNPGLPPAPITLPNPSAIDAVLSPAEHDFIFFAADPDRPGYHNFTSSYAEHLKNAKKYHNWLKANNIK